MWFNVKLTKIFMFMLRSLKLSLKYYGAFKKHIMDKKIKANEKPWLTCVDATTNVINFLKINGSPCLFYFNVS